MTSTRSASPVSVIGPLLLLAGLLHAGGDPQLVASDGAADDSFGTAVDTFGSNAIVGAYQHDGKGADAGAAYLFDLLTGDETHKLEASDGEAADHFGISVGLGADYAVVGAPGDDGNGVDAGAAYLFNARNGAPLAKLLADDGAAGDGFGRAVALSGTLAVVGARSHQGGGAVYVFDVLNGSQLAKLTANDGAGGDEFGHAVDISGTTVVIGARRDDDLGADSGSAYLFDALTGIELHKLLPDDGVAGDGFGYSVALEGNGVLVGAFDGAKVGVVDGAAYGFDAASGAQQARYQPDDTFLDGSFGFSVDVSCSTVVVGGHSSTGQTGFTLGTASAFRLETGELLAKVTNPSVGTGDLFGAAVTLSSFGLLIGAPRQFVGGVRVGAAHAFPTDPTLISVKATPSATTRLTAPDGGANDQFGTAVAMSGDLAVVGAPGKASAPAQGSATVLDAVTGAELFDLQPLAGTPTDEFGASVATDGARILVGDPRSDLATGLAGAAFVFDAATGAAGPTLLASNPSSGARFGWAVDIENGLAVAGAPGSGISGINSGMAYVFDAVTGAQLTTLVPNDGGPRAEFGRAVAIQGTKVLVGAPLPGNSFSLGRGVVYMFDALTGEQLDRWVHGGIQVTDDDFGESLAWEGSLALVGAPRSVISGGIFKGAVYVIDSDTGVQLHELSPPDAEDDGRLGDSVAMSGSLALFGAPGQGGANGAVYVYDLGTFEPSAKLVPDDSLLSVLDLSVAVAGNRALVGTPWDSEQGSLAGAAVHYVLTTSRWTDLCDGLAGVAGVPSLQGEGDLLAGSPFTVSLTGAAPNASTILVLGFSLLSKPLRGGVLVPQPDLITPGLLTDATGSIMVQSVLSPALPPDASFFVQYWIADPTAPKGFAASNALAGTSL